MRHQGFTLVELLVCLAIAAVLATLALSSHRSSLQRARRADARAALLQLQVLEERHYFEHGRYAGTLAALTQPPLERSHAGHYALSISAPADGAGFSARAAPLAGGAQQDDRECREFALNEAGLRTARGSADADRRCWPE